MAEKVRGKQVPLGKFVITKQLTKRPEDYPDAQNQPHVQVALRRRAAGLRNGSMQVRLNLEDDNRHVSAARLDVRGNVVPWTQWFALALRWHSTYSSCSDKPRCHE